MNRLCIIPCGSRKLWDKNTAAAGPYPAKHVYIGDLHRKCQTYAELFFDEWVILSAKHGLLLPEDEISENYNVAFGTKHPDILPITELRQQVKVKQLDRFEEVVVLGGKKFQLVVPHLFREESTITYPLVGSKGIGHMLQRLKHAIDSQVELSAGLSPRVPFA
jgi:hypothetical protein